MEDLPAVDGLAGLWGRDVVACPYCQGWEARDEAVAVVGPGPRAWQHLLLLLRFTQDVVLISNGPARLDDTRLGYLRRAGVVVREDPIARVETDGDRLAAIRFVTGETLPREALFVVTARRQPSDLAARLGCAVLAEGPSAGALDADASGRTSAASVWAAGSSVNPSLTVIGAAGHAGAVAIAINNSLIDEDVAREIAAWNSVGCPVGWPGPQLRRSGRRRRYLVVRQPDVSVAPARNNVLAEAVVATRRNVHATPVRLHDEP